MKYPIETIRHSCAHVMAAAIRELWPSAKFGVGPDIETGFYYDVLFPEPIKIEDLSKIESKMRKIRKKNKKFIKEYMSIDDAKKFMNENNQDFKIDLLNLLSEKGTTTVAKETGDQNSVDLSDGLEEVSFFKVEEFTDLCRGPHVGFTKEIGSFKLHKLAGAYWRGDERKPQLQRIYGLCFETEEEVKAELERLEQVKLRDHRKIGKELGIYHVSEEVGTGLPLWLPNGTIVREELELLAKEEEKKYGYQRVVTPHITNEKLYYQSGHLPYYKDDMYPPIEIEKNNYYLRPMNCPHHHHIYLSRPRSYREVPVRLAEYGQVYRYEDSGALSGLMRTRGFCQNDAHIYCTYSQAKQEFINVMDMHARYYKMFDIQEFYMRFSLPDLEKLDKYVDEPKKWIDASKIIRSAMDESGYPYKEVEGEAAFYGPKVDFMIKSVIGTEQAISTNQLDFLASERFSLHYTGEDGKDHPVYVIHRAPLGSHERFIAFLIEHYNGKLPIWLSPVQALIIPISDRHIEYANRIKDDFVSSKVANASLGLRMDIDSTNERMQKKIRSATLRRIPIIIIVGENEMESETISLRLRDGRNINEINKEEFKKDLINSVENRNDTLFYESKLFV